MGSSLDRLANNLPAEAFKYTSEVFQGEKLRLMMKKGVYPYDYLDSFEKFTKKKMDFRTTCTSDRTSVAVGRPLRKLQEGMLGELQAGFMPLLHASGAVLECYVKMTKMELELMSDINMFQFIEKGMRGGISSIMHRYGKANKLKQGYVEKL